MYKINAQEPIYEFDGITPIKDMTIGKQIANILIMPNPKREMDSVKALILAQNFYQKKEVEVSKKDILDIKTMVSDKGKEFSPLVIGQILIYLEEKINKNKEKKDEKN